MPRQLCNGTASAKPRLRLFLNRDNSFRKTAIYPHRVDVYISLCRSAIALPMNGQE